MKYLRPDQEQRVATFFRGVCCECGEKTGVTDIRNYNYLRPPKYVTIDDIREIFSLIIQEEVTVSRASEILNERIFKRMNP